LSHFINFTAGPAAPEEISPGWATDEQQLIHGREGGLKFSKTEKGKTKFSLVDLKDQVKASQVSTCLEQGSFNQAGTST